MKMKYNRKTKTIIETIPNDYNWDDESEYDERIKTIWIQTSGTGMQAFPLRWHDTSKPMSAEEYFNRITLNNQGNVKA
tara:strand:- start:117 stop:350 length:234 start_codon:yes stop_codon:yes gene_type:complete